MGHQRSKKFSYSQDSHFIINQEVGHFDDNSIYCVFASGQEDHAPSITSTSRTPPTNLLKTMHTIDLKYFDHVVEQQDVSATSMMAFPGKGNGVETRCPVSSGAPLMINSNKIDPVTSS